MGLRFRKSVKIAPGVRLNFSKKSTSVSFGGKGARYTVSSTGRKTASVGIPGTGLSYVETVSGKKKRKDKSNMSALKSKKDPTQKQDKPKKPFYKKWWLWIVVVIAINTIVNGGVTVEKTTPPVDTSPTIAEEQEDQAEVEDIITEEPEAVDPAPVTEDETEEQNVVIAENATTTEETEVPEPVTEEVSEPPVEEPKVEEPVVETPPVIQPEPESEAPAVEVDPEAAFREMLMQYNYVGSAESDKYHKPSCRWTKEINDQNLVHFDTEEEAAAANYKPCGTCKP